MAASAAACLQTDLASGQKKRTIMIIELVLVSVPLHCLRLSLQNNLVFSEEMFQGMRAAVPCFGYWY